MGATRRLLLLLSYLSQDETIASLLGCCADLGIMLVSLIDKFTSLDGGTHPLVDFKVVLKHASDKSSSTTPLKELVFARLFAKFEFGVDVSGKEK